MKIQMICGYRLQQNGWKYKSVILAFGLQIFVITKPATIDLFMFVYFCKTYRQKTIFLTRKYHANLQKKKFCFWLKKKNFDIEKLSFIWPSFWTPTIVWDVLHQWNFFSKKTLKSLYASRQHHDFTEVNPVNYANASIIGAGLREEAITISSAKTIHPKMKAQ